MAVLQAHPFRSSLHPTPIGFGLGIAVIALWALLWLWFFVQLGGSARVPAEVPSGRPAALSAGINPDDQG